MNRVVEGDLSVVFDEEKNSTEIERLTDALNETMQKLATKVYEEAAKNNQSADSANNTDSNSKDNVKDAEYEEK